MGLEMRFEVPALRESLAAALMRAHVGPLAGVSSLVHLQSVRAQEGSLANVADVGSSADRESEKLPLVRVPSRVIPQVSERCEFPGAALEAALVWPLAGVDSHMRIQVALFREGLVTVGIGTHKRPFPSMNPLMNT